MPISVVAVHGLNPRNKRNHAFETWTAANKAMWLRDEGFLRTALPQARVLLFGYNSNVAFKSSTAGVREQAENLLNLLEEARTVRIQGHISILNIPHSLYMIISHILTLIVSC